MSKKYKKRKPPSMAYYSWLDTDGCWWCNNKNGCTGCKDCKRYIALEGGSHRDKKYTEVYKQEMKRLYEDIRK